MKKIIGMALLLVSGFLMVYLTCFSGDAVRFEKLSVNEEQFDGIRNSRRYVSDSNILEALFFDEQRLTFDAGSGTFYYSLEENSKSAYNPCVEMVTEGEDVSVAVLDAQITEQGIKDAEVFRIIAYDSVSYREYNLVCTTLPLMNIECDADIGDEDVSVHMTLFDNSKGAAQKVTQSDGKMHIRGGSTRTYPKKGYKLSLTQKSLGDNVRLNKVSLLGMRQDDDWILYAAYNDPEKVRNVFSSNMWKSTCSKDNALGIDNGMEYRYVELFINHQYWGLYALGYPIDEYQLGIDPSVGERLYKKRTWDGEERILSQPDAVVEGYATKESEEDEWELLKKYYAVLHSDWEDAQKMYDGIDIDNAVDMYLFINLIQGIDHVGVINSLSVKNMFLSFHKKGGEEKALYTPWDMDVTWGLQWTGDAETNMCKAYGIPSSQNTVMGLGNLPSLLLNGDDAIWDLIFDKYWTLRENLWSENYLNDFEKDIYFSGADLRETDRWPNGSYWDADRGLEDFRAYVAARFQELDDYYKRLEELVSGSNATKNVYIIRSAQDKDFLKSDFLLVLNDKNLLENNEYREFLAYLGIDTAQFAENVNFAVVNGVEKKVQYFETVDFLKEVDTCIGCIRMEEDKEAAGSRRFYVNGDLWRTIDLRGQNGIELLYANDFTGQKALRFDFSKQYIMWSRLCELGEPLAWCEELKKNDYDVMIEIVNHDIIEDSRFLALLDGFGVDAERVSKNTDFIAVQNTGGALTILNDSHDSGTRCDTVLGAFSIFYNDEGGYGVYMDGNECILVSPQENDGVDIRVSVFSSEPYEVIWCPEFSY